MVYQHIKWRALTSNAQSRDVSLNAKNMNVFTCADISLSVPDGTTKKGAFANIVTNWKLWPMEKMKIQAPVHNLNHSYSTHQPIETITLVRYSHVI